MSERKFVDWELIERDYRAGIKTVRQIAEERGVSHTAIQKRAKKEEWSRDLTQKVQQKAQELVARTEVAKAVAIERKASDVETVKVYGEVVAAVDLSHREDVKLAMSNARGMLCELVELSKPEFKEILEWMALNFDESTDTFRDKAAEAYRYIIGLTGRVKMAKELAAVHGVYLPMQRKMYKLDEDGAKGDIDTLLAVIGSGE